jgi:hypothetical protein
MLDPREYGLFDPAYNITDPVVKKAIGGRNQVYTEAAAGHVRLTKRGNRTIILAPDLANYLQWLRDQPGALLPSPNPRAHKKFAKLSGNPQPKPEKATGSP